jgi:hypothetical protein
VFDLEVVAVSALHHLIGNQAAMTLAWFALETEQ